MNRSSANIYLKYYEHYSNIAPMVMAWDALLAPSRLRKLALLNRQHDYLNLRDKTPLLQLHREMHLCLGDSAGGWPDYDYGEGYFYQGLKAIGVTGFRDSDARVAAMDLLTLVKDRRVLEIGCNSGFLTAAIAPSAGAVVAFDINPYLIQVARAATAFVGTTNATFAVSRFEDWADDEGYDVVLSFANHSTYDHNTKQTLPEYFARCAALTRPGGYLLFESHPPEHEKGRLGEVLSLISRYFNIVDSRILHYGSFLDKNRTFAIARRLPRGI